MAVPAGAGGTATAMPDLATAMAAARRQGVSVEDISARTEHSRVFVEPSGTSTLESSVTPRWVRRANGLWADLDTGLDRQGDGTFAPRASTADVRFSGGGSGPLVTMRRSGHTFTLSWPGSLPAPVVDRDSATYPEVVPGVDLVVRATRTGFSHVLVVKSRQAASNPAIRHPRLRVGGDATMSDTPEGGLRVTAGTTLVASADAALMWDSRSAEAGPAAAATRSTAAAPADGAHQAAISAGASGGELALTPDPGLLDSPAAVFPIFIDPDFSTGPQNWTYATSDNTGSPTTDNHVRPGDSAGPNVRVGRDEDTGKRLRSFLDFPLVTAEHDLRGTHLLSATFSGRIDHTANCTTDYPNYFYRTAAISAAPRQSWPGPELQAAIGNYWTSANEIKCNEPNSYFEIVDNALLADLRSAAAQRWDRYTIGLSAAANASGSGEGDNGRWMRYFLDDFRLVVRYNTNPDTPTDLLSGGQPCRTGTARPWLGTVTPALRARVTDRDAGETDMTLHIDWFRIQPDGTYGPQLGTVRQNALAAGTVGQLTLPPLDQGDYAWRALADDGTDWAYNYSGWCEFSVDSVPPAVSPEVSSPVYKDDLVNYYGSVGKTANFTFTANGVTDVASYEYGWNDPPATQVAAPSLGAGVTRPLTPPPPSAADPTRAGQLTLYVRSLDRAGNKSPIKRYTFLIGSASSPAGEWLLNETSGNTLNDSSGYDHHAALSGGTLGTPGPRPGATALVLDGIDDYAATAGPVLDTTTSFTVAGWVKLIDSAAIQQTIVSQLGSLNSAFYLQKVGNNWAMTVQSVDTDAPVWVRVPSSSAVAVGVWTHLAGVYDQASGSVRLYVNGELAGSATGASAFPAPNALWIGRAWYRGRAVDPFAGAISGMRVWDRVLHPSEITRLPAG
ncbi:MAG: LamG domain-containing protein [Labedaea sp.]